MLNYSVAELRINIFFKDASLFFEAILAGSLVKLGFEAGRRTEPHVLLASTAVPFHVYVHSDKKMKNK